MPFRAPLFALQNIGMEIRHSSAHSSLDSIFFQIAEVEGEFEGRAYPIAAAYYFSISPLLMTTAGIADRINYPRFIKRLPVSNRFLFLIGIIKSAILDFQAAILLLYEAD